ncbi:putative transcription factor interactor and regulator CCHC(Zn) family [Helianthus annuus]|nr:putative transcription factor interactor and regulator CCHC(Zn) family [Helianthus annuus]KAJ0617975.1 putative transcription factor interactor and regulator CCHC(Zn) family [Helianthus annuus]
MMAEIVEVPEMVTKPEMIVEDVPVVVKDVPVENVIDIEEIAAEVYYYQSEQEVLASSMKSIMPPKVFESFAGFFEEPTTGSCPRYEEEKEVVEEMIDVTKELTGDTLKDIADRALMGKLKEVDTEPEKSKSVSTVTVKQESDQKSGVEEVKVSESELKHVGKQDVTINCDEQVVEKVVSIPETPCQKCLQPCMECLEKDTNLQELKHHADMLKFDRGQVKEAYDTLARSIKMIQKESVENDKATKLVKATLFDKQIEVNFHLDTIASLKKELELAKIENDRIDKKFMSYVASSYVLEQIVPQQPHAAPVFNSVPPPMWNHYTQKYPDGVEAALNIKLRSIKDDLPESIDVIFSASNTDNESQVIKAVVDQVLDEESDNSEKSQSEKSVIESEDEGNFLDRFISKSDKSANDDPIMVVYTMIGTDKLYSDFEYPLQNVKIEHVEKVFKLVEMNIDEVNNKEFFSKPKKSFVTSHPTSSRKKEWEGKGNNKKNNFKNKGIGFEKKMAKQVVKPKEKMNDIFVAGPSVDDEKGYIFSQKAVDDFNALKKLIEETFKSTFVEYDKRVCYRCNEIRHMAKQCKKVFEKLVFVKPVVKKPRPKPPIDTKGKKPMVSPIRILKRGESLKSEEKPKSTFEVGESSKSRKTSKIYPKTKIFENQSWVAKSKPSVEMKKMENALKNETKVLKDDVVDFESELDKFLAEFPPINNKVKPIVKDDVPNVAFNFPA